MHVTTRNVNMLLKRMRKPATSDCPSHVIAFLSAIRCHFDAEMQVWIILASVVAMLNDFNCIYFDCVHFLRRLA